MKEYILKPFKKNQSLEELDQIRRDKVEKTIGKKLSDSAWVSYKKMTIHRNKNS